MSKDGYTIIAALCIVGAVVLAALGKEPLTYAGLVTLAGTVVGRGAKKT